MISTVTARRIASEWHGGYGTRLHTFAATGRIADRRGLLADIDDAVPYARRPEQRRRLAMLGDFVRRSP